MGKTQGSQPPSFEEAFGVKNETNVSQPTEFSNSQPPSFEDSFGIETETESLNASDTKPAGKKVGPNPFSSIFEKAQDFIVNKYGEQVDLAGFINDDLGSEASFLEEAYSKGNFSPEAFGRTDTKSVEIFSDVMGALKQENAIARRINKLRTDEYTTQAEADKANAEIKKLVEQFSEKRIAAADAFDKIANDLVFDANKSTAQDKYGIGIHDKPIYNEKGELTGHDQILKIQTRKEFDKEYQGIIVATGKDKQTNDAFATLGTNKGGDKMLAWNDFQNIVNQKDQAKKANGIHEVGNSFTQHALADLSSKDPSTQRAAFEWIDGIVRADNAIPSWVPSWMQMGSNNKQFHKTLSMMPQSYGEKINYYKTQREKIQQMWDNMPQSVRDNVVEAAVDNKNPITTNNNYWPANQDKSVSDYKNDVKAWKQIGIWEKELDKNQVEIAEMVMSQAINKKDWWKLAQESGGKPRFSIMEGRDTPAEKAYRLAFDEKGNAIGFENWVNKLGASNWTMTRGGKVNTLFGLFDKEGTKYSENILQHLGFNPGNGKYRVNDYNSFMNAYNAASKQSKGTMQAFGAPVPGGLGLYGTPGDMSPSSPAQLKNYYNKIVNNYKRMYDEYESNRLYDRSLIYGGFGNKSAVSMTTVGLNGTIGGENDLAIVNPGTGTEDGTLNKQRNFAKIYDLLHTENKWTTTEGSYTSPVAVTKDFVHNMTHKQFKEKSEWNAAYLNEFFNPKKDLSRLQMTYMKYSPVPGHSVYKLYNPVKTEGTITDTIYLTIANDKLKEIKEDNYTYSQNNWMQETFNIDGEMELTNRKKADGSDLFNETPKLVNHNNRYAVEYVFEDSKGNYKTLYNDIGPLYLDVQDAQRLAGEYLDQYAIRNQ